jgi:beta-xylosidase
LQKNYGWVGIKVNGDSNSVVMINAATGRPEQEAVVKLNQPVVWFKVQCDFTNRNDVAVFFYSLDGVKWVQTGTPLKMTYTLPHFMGYRFGLFNYSTKEAGGHADFDYFRIKPVSEQ